MGARGGVEEHGDFRVQLGVERPGEWAPVGESPGHLRLSSGDHYARRGRSLRLAKGGGKSTSFGIRRRAASTSPAFQEAGAFLPQCIVVREGCAHSFPLFLLRFSGWAPIISGRKAA